MPGLAGDSISRKDGMDHLHLFYFLMFASYATTLARDGLIDFLYTGKHFVQKPNKAGSNVVP